MHSLENKTALVTGATNGIGKAIALHLAAEGATVVVHGRDAARGAETVAAIEAAGGSARFVAADLAEPAEVARLAAEAGAVDVLVNNAGLADFGPTAGFDLDAYDRMFAVNVRAPYLLVGALAPGMVERGSGSIIGLSSMVDTVGLDGAAAYGATKSAVSSMTRHWSAEYARSGVRANAIAPGPVHTREEAAEFIDGLGSTTPMERAAQPEEIAELAGFLASSRSSYVTGAVFAADGGRAAV